MKKGVRIALIAVLALVFVVSGVRLIVVYRGYARAEKIYSDIRDSVLTVLPNSADTTPEASPSPDASAAPSATLRPLPSSTPERENKYIVDFAALSGVAPAAVGWIIIPGTNVSFPVMQGDDNDYYLTHAYNGEYSSSGSIFLDFRCAADFSGCHSIVYGHNMKNGSMFGELGEFRDSAYISAHPSIYILTVTATYRYDIFSVYITSADYDSYNLSYDTGEAFDAYGATLDSYSWYDTPAEFAAGDKVLTLSTCVGDKSKRMVIHAALRDTQAQ